jgi:hypothetical protein
MQYTHFFLTDTGLKSGGGVLENLWGRTLALVLLVTLCAFENSKLRAANQINVSPDGPVFATTTAADGTVYFGGSFTKLNPQTGGGALLNSSSGEVSLAFPYVHGTVYATIPDGAGGWYIGGNFDTVGGQSRQNLAQINAAGFVTTWSPSANSTVFALALDATRGRVFVGGSFSTINATASPNLAVVDTTGALMTGWNLHPNNVVYAMAITSSRLYFGGYFGEVNGVDQQKIASIDLTTDTLLDWNPKPDSPVDLLGEIINDAYINALAVSGDTVYAGGSFTSVGNPSVTKTSLVAIGSNGIPTSWNPALNNTNDVNNLSTVNALAVVGNLIYVGGIFTAVNGSTRSNIAAIGTDGTLSTWAPAIDNPDHSASVRTLAVSGTTAYVGGLFTTVDSSIRTNAAAIVAASDDPVTPSVTTWAPQPDQPINAIAINGSSVFVGGEFSTLGGKSRLNLAAFNSDGTISNWNPGADNAGNTANIQAITVSGSTVYIGGSFTYINTTTLRNNLAAVDLSGTPTSWDPNADDTVRTLFVLGSRIYAGGDFTHMGESGRSHVAAIKSDGTLWDWNPGTDRPVYSIVGEGNNVYLGGAFTTVASAPRNHLAGVDLSGTVLTWNPNANDAVFSLQFLNSSIYAAGAFTAVGSSPSSRGRFAEIGLDGALKGWSPSADNTVLSLLVSGSTIYAAGNFSTINGFPRNHLALLGINGAVGNWDPSADNDTHNASVYSLAVSGSTLYAGGGFTALSSELKAPSPFQNLAALNTYTDTQAPTVSSVDADTASGIYDAGTVLSIKIAFSESVAVTGTPKLILNTGAAPHAATYVDGSGTATLNFTYTVQAGDTASQLDYLNTSALQLNGGSISDALGNAATLTLAPPGTTGSIGISRSIVLNTQTPTDISLSSNRVAAASPTGSTVATLSATDGDTGDTFSYSLVAGTGDQDNSRFSISGSLLQVLTPPAISDGTYSVRLRVTDAIGHVFDKSFNILVMAVLINPGDYLIADRGPFRNTGTILVVNKVGSVQRVISTQLKDPYDLTTDAAGNLLVADYDYDPTGFGSTRGSSIFKINFQTGETTRLAFGPPLVTPLGVRSESSGKLLVVDPDYGFGPGVTSAGAVFRIDPGVSTNALSKEGNFYFLQGMAVAPDGEIYVSDFGNGGGRPNRIIHVDSNTGVQTVMTSGGFQRPIGLAAESDGSSLVVVDAVAKKLVRVSLPGGVQTDISNDSQFIQPTHVAIEADGSYIVSDGKSSLNAGERRIFRVNRSTGVATLLVSDGFFQQPRGVAIAR